MNAGKSRAVLIALGIALLAVIMLPLLLMGVTMGGMMGGGGMMRGWGPLAVVILVVGAGLLATGLARRS